MKHSKLWTALALPLMLAACAKSDKAGVSAPDCLNISGEWDPPAGPNSVITQDGCASLTMIDGERTYNFSTSEQNVEGVLARVEFAPTQVKIIYTKTQKFAPMSLNRVETVTRVTTETFKKISEDVLEYSYSYEDSTYGISSEPSIEQWIRVKPIQAEQTPTPPVSETQTAEVQTEEGPAVEPIKVEPAPVEPAQENPAQVEPAQVEPAPTKRDPYAILNQIRQNLGDKLSKLKWN